MNRTVSASERSISVGGDAYIHYGSWQDLPESERQAAFKKTTGIDCDRFEREYLELLAEQHGFKYSDLAAARREGSLKWRAKSRTMQIMVFRFDPWMGNLMRLTPLAFAAYYSPRLFSMGNSLGYATGLFLVALALSVFMWADQKFMRPYRVALAVREAETPTEK